MSTVHSPIYQTNLQAVETMDNPHRQVMLWTVDIENVITTWYDRCRSRAKRHLVRSDRYIVLNMLLVIPSSVIPLTLVSFSTLLLQTHTVFVGGMIVTGCLSTIMGVLNPSGRSRQHNSFATQYNELATEISTELVKPQRHRLEADVFLQRIMDKFNFLNNLAPPLPPV